MDKKEAISILKQLNAIINNTNNGSWSDDCKTAINKAFDLAIKALQESEDK